MGSPVYTMEPVGFIHSELTQLEDAPMQGDEGAPDAWLELTPSAAPGLRGIQPGDELIVTRSSRGLNSPSTGSLLP